MKAALLFTTFLFTSLIVRADPPANNDRARELVQELGSRDYRTREKATEELSTLGRAAYAALRQGQNDPDPEIRARSTRLFPRAYDLEMKARIDSFVADTQGKQAHDLPGWERFRKLLGDDAQARGFFASMARADSRLMDAIETQPPQYGLERLLIRCTMLQQQMYPRSSTQGEFPTQADIGEILFLAVNPRLEEFAQAAPSINQFLYHPEVHTWFDSGDAAPLMKKLLLAWLERDIDDRRSGMMVANLMNSLEFKELTDLALKLVVQKKVDARVRARMLVAFGRLKQKDIVDRIHPLINDDTLVAQSTVGTTHTTTQLGDIALAVAIQLSGQSVNDYGFDGLRGGASFSSYYRMGFSSDEKRTAAHKKWNDWRDQQKK